MFMRTKSQAEEWAQSWINTWNTRDVEAAMAFYCEDVEYVSPFVARMYDVADGTLRGKALLRGYFEEVLAAYPETQFELFDVFVGVQSVVLFYSSIQGLKAAEAITLDENDCIAKSITHYR
jgi:ketosteroid isomerase-like protein